MFEYQSIMNRDMRHVKAKRYKEVQSIQFNFIHRFYIGQKLMLNQLKGKNGPLTRPFV